MLKEDNYSLFERNEAEEAAWLAKRPICDICGEHIQDDHYFDINDEVICPDCMDSFRREIE